MNLTISFDFYFELKDLENQDVSVMKKCVFCAKKEIKRKGIRQRLIQTQSEATKNEIYHLLTESTPLVHLTENQTINYFYYHSSCLQTAKTTSDPALKTEMNAQKMHSSQVFTEIKGRLQQTIFTENGIFSLAELYEEYSNLFEESLVRHNIGVYSMVTPRQLLRKLFSAFSSLSKTIIKNRTFIHSSTMSYEEINRKICSTGSLSTQIKTVAFEIRKKILRMEHRSMPKRNITIDDVLNGESDCPSELLLLIECLLKGPKQKISQRKDMRISKICDDLIFNITNGDVKPSSSICLGLVTKSITSSRKMVEILNRMGHCCSYSTIEEVETELAYRCAAEPRLLPFGLKEKQPQLCTHVAFDNFDRYVETSTGKDTLHDTVGIVYQNKSIESSTVMGNFTDNSNEESVTDDIETEFRRRRKYFSSFNDVIEPYIASKSQTTKLFGNDPVKPISWTEAFDLDNLWMFHFKFCSVNTSVNTKRWFSWNSERVHDENPTQVIGYLPNLNVSPTNDAVVMKTLEMANQLADECDQKYIVATYDLAIAMKAYQIRDSMSPRFDRIFVNLGGFHIEMSYFKVCIINFCSQLKF